MADHGEGNIKAREKGLATTMGVLTCGAFLPGRGPGSAPEHARYRLAIHGRVILLI